MTLKTASGLQYDPIKRSSLFPTFSRRRRLKAAAVVELRARERRRRQKMSKHEGRDLEGGGDGGTDQSTSWSVSDGDKREWGARLRERDSARKVGDGENKSRTIEKAAAGPSLAIFYGDSDVAESPLTATEPRPR